MSNFNYNPKDKDINELPTIFGFNNGGPQGFMSGALIAEDGTGMGGHLCSNEGFMIGDLGIDGSRSDRHETFRKHYPDGYKMEFVSCENVRDHKELMKAITIANEAGAKAEAEKETAA